FLAALGGIIGGPFVGVYPRADFEILEMALVVVIIGGLGSLKGPSSAASWAACSTTSARRCSRSSAWSPRSRRWPRAWRSGPPACSAPGEHARRGWRGRARDARRVARGPVVLSAEPSDQDAHLRHLRHEPRSAPRLRGLAVAGPRRLLRRRRVHGRPPG